jgi:serine/threonine protein kinase
MRITKSTPAVGNKLLIGRSFLQGTRLTRPTGKGGKRSTVPSRPLEPGDKIRGTQGGVYRLNEIVGKGARACTFRARVLRAPRTNSKTSSSDAAVGMTVIVKTPRIDPQGDPQRGSDFVAMVNRSLEHEIRMTGKLQGVSAVAQILDWGQSPVKLRDGSDVSATYVVQQYIDGPRLDKYLTDCFAEKGRPFKGISTSDEWFNLAKSLAITVKLVHQRGVCHQDIWGPNFVMRDRDHVPCLIDFGEAAMRLTSYLPWRLKIHPHPYMDPELRRNAKWPSRRADLYSLGGVLLFLAVGEHPPLHLPKNNDKLKSRITQIINIRNPGLLRSNCAIADVIARCLRHNREQRVPNVETLIQELETFQFCPLNLREIVNELDQLVKPLGAHQLFSRTLALELRQLVCRVQDMVNGMLDVNGDHETIVSALTQYLSGLDRGDQYLTVTVPQFWHGGNLGINGRYLTMNRLLAEKGVRIRRVFLLTREDQSNTEVRKILEAHCAMTARLSDDAVDLRVIPVNRQQRDEAIQNGDHCGIWIQDDLVMKIVPVYDDQGVLRTVRFRTSNESVSSILNWFERYASRGLPLKQWLLKAEAAHAA